MSFSYHLKRQRQEKREEQRRLEREQRLKKQSSLQLTAIDVPVERKSCFFGDQDAVSTSSNPLYHKPTSSIRQDSGSDKEVCRASNHSKSVAQSKFSAARSERRARNAWMYENSSDEDSSTGRKPAARTTIKVSKPSRSIKPWEMSSSDDEEECEKWSSSRRERQLNGSQVTNRPMPFTQQTSSHGKDNDDLPSNPKSKAAARKRFWEMSSSEDDETPPIRKMKSSGNQRGSTHSNSLGLDRQCEEGSRDHVDDSGMSRAVETSRGESPTQEKVDCGDQDTLPSSFPEKKSAKNPLVLMQEELKQSIASAHTTNHESSLWSDDDDGDDDFESQAKKRKRKPSKRKKVASGFSQIGKSVAYVPSFEDGGEERREELAMELKPQFEKPKFGPHEPPEPMILDEKFRVPMSINRYLPPFQQDGIRFLFEKAVAMQRGVILGDDMGLGKTVQLIGLLSALLLKSGSGLDLLELSKRAKSGNARAARLERERESSHRAGRVGLKGEGDSSWSSVVGELNLPPWCPILITAPNSVVSHWKGDLDVWGHFSIAIYSGKNRDKALESIEQGIAEILICGHSMMQSAKDSRLLRTSNVKWKLLVIDEFHKFKNQDASMTQHLRKLRDENNSLVIGLTGTVMPNEHKELWNLVDLVAPNFFKDWDDFQQAYAKPIKLSIQKDATTEVIDIGKKKKAEIQQELKLLYLHRKKEVVLADVLPQKHESVVFCELTELQKRLYNHLLFETPDYEFLRKCNSPCDCGVNQKFFLEYKRLRTKKEKVEYHRRNKSSLLSRTRCCYPFPQSEADPRDVHPKAALWRQQHEGTEPCNSFSCPICTLLVSLSILVKVSSHASLLQTSSPPDQFGAGSKQRFYAENELERAKVFIPNDCLAELPGGYVRENSLMDDHFRLSGKMVALDRLLKRIYSVNGRVLLFSCYTTVLDLVQNYLEAKGYNFHRMDGQTPQNKRDEIADQFRTNKDSFVFLLSTKAMGTGLNLREANFVIIFDPDWNPANDRQAQDRAYRIGQERDVKVIRLIARGTVEEMKYLRQIYKTNLTSETIERQDDKHEGRFRGVQDDISRKGELFGLENLLKFKDGKLMRYPVNQLESSQFGVEMCDAGMISEKVNNADPETLPFCNTMDDLDNFPQEQNPTEVEEPLDSDIDECHLGGESQVAVEVMDQIDISSPLFPIEEVDGANIPSQPDVKPLLHVDSHPSAESKPKRTKEPTPTPDSCFSNSSEMQSSSRQQSRDDQSKPNGELASYCMAPMEPKQPAKRRNYTLVGRTDAEIKKEGTANIKFAAKDLPPPSS